MTLPFSQSCENNKKFILEVLSRHLKAPGNLIEIAGGTGQHAEFFSAALPHIHWQSSDIPSNTQVLNQRLVAADLPPALDFDVTQERFEYPQVDYVFSANSLHIMPATAVIEFFRHMKYLLKPEGILCVYGPFKYEGEFTTPSNAQFDLWLKGNNPLSGIRDFEKVCELASGAGLELIEDNAMPANNQLLVWRKLR